MNLEWFFEGVFVDLRRLDLSEIVLDINEVFVGNDGNHELLVVFEEGKAEKSC